MSLLPPKKSGSFKNVDDLNNTLKVREKLLAHSKLLCKWMYNSSGFNPVKGLRGGKSQLRSSTVQDASNIAMEEW